MKIKLLPFRLLKTMTFSLILGCAGAGCDQAKKTTVSAQASSPAPTPFPAGPAAAAPAKVVETHKGTATWYDVPDGSLAKRRGPESGLSAAHRNLPIGTKVRVTNQKNGDEVTVEVTDRAPGKGVAIDVSKEAAEELEMVRDGKAPVKMEVLQSPPKKDEKKP